MTGTVLGCAGQGSERGRMVAGRRPQQGQLMEYGTVAYSTKRQLHRRILSLWEEGALGDRNDSELKYTLFGSADRYAEIAFGLQRYPKVLDVGSGSGLLLSVLARLGHQCWGLDLMDPAKLASPYRLASIQYQQCNVEVDPYPFPEAHFDAVTCCQVLEHFSHSPLMALGEMRRVLTTGGVIEIDVPNAVCFRNRLRMIRGKHITWDYRDHYLHARPLLYKGYSFYPFRHNREFTRAELAGLLAECGFVNVQVRFLKDRNHRTGFDKLLAVGSATRNLIPSWRKSLIAFGRKEQTASTG
jgi:SAM-dependent methyltransferase